MTGRVYVRDLEILLNLEVGLGQFNYGANTVIEGVAHGIKSSEEQLRTRVAYWQAELRRREAAYNACRGDDKDRDCRAEVAAVREAQEALEKLRRLSVRFEQAIAEYKPAAKRLQVLGGKISKAKGDLSRSVQKYKDYLAHASSQTASSTSGVSSSPLATSGKAPFQSITWAEKRAILKKIDDGQTITADELEKLKLPISDLQAGTLQEDTGWIQQLIDSQGYLEAMRDSREAQGIHDAILATLKAINYWHSK